MQISDQAQKLQQFGRHGDTMLAHINPEEALILRLHGGSGSINPYTGLPEFFAPSPGGIGAGGEQGIGSEGFGGGGGDDEDEQQSRGMEAISNAVDQLGGVGPGETAKGEMLSWTVGDEGPAAMITGLAERTGMSPGNVAAALSGARGSRPSQMGVGASLGQNLAGIGVTPSAAETAASISGPGFGSRAEQVRSISNVGQASRAAGMVDPDLTERLSGAVAGITPQSVSKAARALQGMRATPGGSAPLVGNLNVREPSLGVPVGFADIPNPGQVGRVAGGYAAQIAQGIQNAMASAAGPGPMASASGYQGAAMGAGGPFGMPSGMAATSTLAPSTVAPTQTAPTQVAQLSAPAAFSSAPLSGPATPAAIGGPFGADRGEQGSPTPRLAPPVLPTSSYRTATPEAQPAGTPNVQRPLFQVRQGTYGPYDPALQRILGLSGPTSLAFG